MAKDGLDELDMVEEANEPLAEIETRPAEPETDSEPTTVSQGSAKSGFQKERRKDRDEIPREGEGSSQEKIQLVEKYTEVTGFKSAIQEIRSTTLSQKEDLAKALAPDSPEKKEQIMEVMREHLGFDKLEREYKKTLDETFSSGEMRDLIEEYEKDPNLQKISELVTGLGSNLSGEGSPMDFFNSSKVDPNSNRGKAIAQIVDSAGLVDSLKQVASFMMKGSSREPLEQERGDQGSSDNEIKQAALIQVAGSLKGISDLDVETYASSLVRKPVLGKELFIRSRLSTTEVLNSVEQASNKMQDILGGDFNNG